MSHTSKKEVLKKKRSDTFLRSPRKECRLGKAKQLSSYLFLFKAVTEEKHLLRSTTHKQIIVGLLKINILFTFQNLEIFRFSLPAFCCGFFCIISESLLVLIFFFFFFLLPFFFLLCGLSLCLGLTARIHDCGRHCSVMPSSARRLSPPSSLSDKLIGLRSP